MLVQHCYRFHHHWKKRSPHTNIKSWISQNMTSHRNHHRTQQRCVRSAYPGFLLCVCVILCLTQCHLPNHPSTAMYRKRVPRCDPFVLRTIAGRWTRTSTVDFARPVLPDHRFLSWEARPVPTTSIVDFVWVGCRRPPPSESPCRHRETCFFETTCCLGRKNLVRHFLDWKIDDDDRTRAQDDPHNDYPHKPHHPHNTHHHHRHHPARQ